MQDHRAYVMVDITAAWEQLRLQNTPNDSDKRQQQCKHNLRSCSIDSRPREIENRPRSLQETLKDLHAEHVFVRQRAAREVHVSRVYLF